MLVVAVLAWILLIGVARLIGDPDNLTLDIASEGIIVAGWVILWFPLDLLIFTGWQRHLDKRIYTVLMEADVSIEPTT